MFELKKIGIVKRASAWLLDAILLAVLTTGFMFLISLIAGYGHQQSVLAGYYEAWDQYRIEHLADIAEHYGYDYTVEDEEGLEYKVTPKDSDKEVEYFEVILKMANDPPKEDDPDTALVSAYDAYLELCGTDREGTVVNKDGIPLGRVAAQNKLVNSLIFTMLSMGLLLAYLVLEFILPIILKNGQTVGKKVFSIELVRPNCVKITTLALFARTILGKFAIETMFPVLLIFMLLFGNMGWLALLLLGALLLLNAILFFATKNRTPIHDLLAGTVAVDAKLQMVYYSEDELNEAKSLLHKEEVINSRS